MPDETPMGPDAASEPAAPSEAAPDDTTGTNPEPSAGPGAGTAQAGDGSGDDAAEAVSAPAAPAAPVQSAAPAPPGQSTLAPSAGPGRRRIIRHTTTTRTESKTTTDETVVEDIAIAPAVWAAPASEHPRPVG